MNVSQLISEIKSKKSYLCVGLDTDITKLPDGVPKNTSGILEFNREIINATKDYAVAYKMNTAFYEQLGSEGWKVLEKTREMLPSNVLSIADAKRGDIGNTSTMYAKAFFETMDFDAITVAPYMGLDSVEPFLKFDKKITIVLGLTSNQGSLDFQTNALYHPPLYQTVLQRVSTWSTMENLMFVVGATKADALQEIRNIVPDHFLLIPGVGAQGGSATEVCQNGKNKNGGLLINSSRGIIYASGNSDFAEVARAKAKELAEETQPYTTHL
ncbi:orotidine-5'-phosphate decarboxylase [Bacteroidia bacterium]|nr:orotidine-5'-phosphate decarboxylase [Bacteroidota bacterium]MDA8930079.1 orotidine-5'-phosphate decarboxylase [Bacteroidia bacterium]MDB4173708.1 orotidine-5'-phosphate decarboxylase [Bacteroidia bacterium]